MILGKLKMSLPREKLNLTPSPVVLFNDREEVIWINDAFQRLSGCSPSDLEACHNMPFLPVRHEKDFKYLIRQAFLGNQTESVKIPIKITNKTTKDILWSAILIPEETQKIVMFLGVEPGCQDKGQSKNEIAEGQYRVLFENTGVGLMYIGEDAIIALVNKEFTKLTGYSKSDVEGRMSWTELIEDKDDLQQMKIYHRLRRIDPALAPEAYNTKVRTQDGAIRNVTVRVAMIPGTTCSLVSMLDITETVLAEESLFESEEKYRSLVDNIQQDTIYRADLNGDLTFVSASGMRLLGYDSMEEIIGLNISRDFYFDPEERSLLINELKKNGRVTHYEVTLKRKDGSPVFVSTNSHLYYDKEGNIRGVEGIFTDITERKHAEEARRKLERQLVHSQKMDAIGQLAGGVAHDINNILMGIQGNISLMLMGQDAGHPNYQRLIQMEEHIKRGSNLTRQLLGFAREGKYEVKTLSINDLIMKSAQLYLNTRKEIKAEFKLSDEVHPVEADPGQMEQAFLNIYINAGHAMPKGGTILIQTRNIKLQKGNIEVSDLKEGDYVEISITDTGTGMDKETLDKIFDPFFTTKSERGGTGLGLASVYGIIRNHGGAVNVFSELGQGSTFYIYLPSSKKKIQQAEEPRVKTLCPGSGSILLVDDELMILETASDMLTMLGYSVYRAASGQEAISVYRENQGKIDLVILDMILPGTTGAQVLNILKDINPDIKVILSSGYGLQGEIQKLMGIGCCGFIQKPYDFTDLSTIVHQVINSPGQIVKV
ncbi:MAG: PAS domain S-box protein [Deltaproteobacteria bacterium]|nr:PAS domain S-box protein [Deltaproteobacteria bacterium]